MRNLKLFVAMVATLGWASSATAQTSGDGDAVDDEGYTLEDGGDPVPPPAPDEQAPEPQWQYAGPHAVNAEYGSGWCNLEGLHTHPYPPFDDQLFQEQDNTYYFEGDPVDFGYTGEVVWYETPHPIAAGWGLGWCFMNHPHRHIYRPWGGGFATCRTGYCWTGGYDSFYASHARGWGAYWNTSYARYYHDGRYYQTHRPASPGRWAGYRQVERHGWAPPMPPDRRVVANDRRGPRVVPNRGPARIPPNGPHGVRPDPSRGHVTAPPVHAPRPSGNVGHSAGSRSGYVAPARGGGSIHPSSAGGYVGPAHGGGTVSHGGGSGAHGGGGRHR